MQDYQTLIAEHVSLDRLALRLITAAEAPIDVAGALAARLELSVELEDHLRREDAFLYDPLITSSNGEVSAAVGAFHRDFARLAGDWTEYLRSWDKDCIAADWDGFAGETLAMMARLRERIAEENRLLYPLALQRGHIRLRAAA